VTESMENVGLIKTVIATITFAKLSLTSPFDTSTLAKSSLMSPGDPKSIKQSEGAAKDGNDDARIRTPA